MRILHTVQAYYPESGGSEEVVRKLSENLVSRGHEVTVATRRSPMRTFNELNGVRIVEFECGGNSVQGISGAAQSYRDFVAGGEFEIMMNYAAQIWTSDLLFDLLPSLKSKNVFVPCGYSLLRDPRYAGYYEKMPDILRRYDRVVYLSPDYIDAKYARENRIENGVVIPNGAGLSEFTESRRGEYRRKHGLNDELLLINVSNHSSLKNHAFFWNCVRMLKGEDVSSVLIGNAFHKFPKKWLTECYAQCRGQGVRLGVPVLESLPRAEVVEAYVDADIFIFGSLVECSPLVMFESFAGKTLFITTECGNVKEYEDVVCIVKNENEAVAIVKDFQKHPEKYQERIEKGYSYFTGRLNWELIAVEYERLYLSL